MKLVIITQCRENYGSKQSPYWKMKGGSEYIVDDIEHFLSINDEFFEKKLRSIICDTILPKIEVFNDMYTESYVTHTVEEDDYIPDFETSQMEYEGFIRYYEPRIDIEGNRISRPSNTVPTNIVLSDN